MLNSMILAIHRLFILIKSNLDFVIEECIIHMKINKGNHYLQVMIFLLIKVLL